MFLNGPVYEFLTYNESYNTVLVVLGIIWSGIWLHIWYLNRKVNRLLKESEEAEKAAR